jgi:uncharacterized repeat protein (TIGR02543 family)
MRILNHTLKFAKKYATALCLVMLGFVLSQPAAAQYTLQDEDVVIEDGIIGACFYDFEEKEIIIPETLQGQVVKGIGDGAQYWGGPFGYKDLTSITFPKTIEYIGKYACRNNNFTTLDFSYTNINYIGGESFCQSGIQSIDFTGCENLDRIEWWAFLGNDLTSIDLTPCVNLDYIGYRAFSGNSLSSVDITACISLKTIAVNAFKSNPGLAGFILPYVETEGYSLDYWEASLSETDIWFMVAGDSVTNFTALYKARMELATYNITYYADGGIHNNDTAFTMEDSVVISPASKEGYEFLGWYDNAELSGEPVTLIALGIMQDIELWASFEAINYTITYNADGGLNTNPSEYTIESAFALVDASKEGYEFLGWFNNDEFSGNSITDIAIGTMGNLEFWAKWQEASGVAAEISDMINVYPNPVEETCVISHHNISIESICLFNAAGKSMISESISGTMQTSMYMADFEAGLYYLTIYTSGGKLITKKIVKIN